MNPCISFPPNDRVSRRAECIAEKLALALDARVECVLAAERKAFMRTVQFLICVFAVAFFASTALPQEVQPVKKLSIIGKLTRVMAIGGESTGWSLELKRSIALEGKKMRSIEISGPAEEFEKLNGQRVRAKGSLTHRTGVERADHLVLEVTSISAVK